MRRSTPWILLALSLFALPLLPTISTPTVNAGDIPQSFPLMYPDEETLQEWVHASDTAPRTKSVSMSRST